MLRHGWTWRCKQRRQDMTARRENLAKHEALTEGSRAKKQKEKQRETVANPG